MPATPVPPPYVRQASFTDWEANHPGEPNPGTQLDAEFNAVQVSITDTQARLAQIQRDDGALANDSVGLDQLSDEAMDFIEAEVTAIKNQAVVARDQAEGFATASAGSANASQASAVASAASAAESAAYAAPNARFCGSLAAAPATRLNGDPLQEGDEYQNTVDHLRYNWTGTAWAALNSSAQSLETRLADLADPAKGAALLGRAAQVVNNLAAMRSLSKNSPSKFAFALGHTKPFDGGGGPYQVDVLDSISVDDNGICVVNPTDGGRWKLVHNGTVSIDVFGADAVRLTDATVPVQAALNCGLTKVTMGEKTYKITTVSVPLGVTFEGLSGFSNTGTGKSMIIASETVANCVVLAGNSSRLHNIEVTGISSKTVQGGPVACNGVYVPSGVSAAAIKDCVIHNFGGQGAATGDAGGLHFELVCLYENKGTGLLIGAGCSDSRFLSITSRDNGVHGGSCSGGANSNWFAWCRWEWNLGAGFVYENCNHSTFFGNQFDRNTRAGFEDKGTSVRGAVNIIGGWFRRNGANDGVANADYACHILTQSVIGAVVASGVLFLSGNTQDDGSGIVVPKYVVRNVNTTETLMLMGCSVAAGFTVAVLQNVGTITHNYSVGSDDPTGVHIEQAVISRNGQLTLRREGATVPDRMILNTNFNTFGGRQQMADLPGSTVGLTAGELYVDGSGFVKRV